MYADSLMRMVGAIRDEFKNRQERKQVKASSAATCALVVQAMQEI